MTSRAPSPSATAALAGPRHQRKASTSSRSVIGDSGGSGFPTDPRDRAVTPGARFGETLGEFILVCCVGDCTAVERSSKGCVLLGVVIHSEPEMNGLIYLIGLIVVILFILSFLGLR